MVEEVVVDLYDSAALMVEDEVDVMVMHEYSAVVVVVVD